MSPPSLLPASRRRQHQFSRARDACVADACGVQFTCAPQDGARAQLRGEKARLRVAATRARREVSRSRRAQTAAAGAPPLSPSRCAAMSSLHALPACGSAPRAAQFRQTRSCPRCSRTGALGPHRLYKALPLSASASRGCHSSPWQQPALPRRRRAGERRRAQHQPTRCVAERVKDYGAHRPCARHERGGQTGARACWRRCSASANDDLHKMGRTDATPLFCLMLIPLVRVR